MAVDIMYVQGHKHKRILPSKDIEERKSNRLIPNAQMKTYHDNQTSLSSNSTHATHLERESNYCKALASALPTVFLTQVN